MLVIVFPRVAINLPQVSSFKAAIEDYISGTYAIELNVALQFSLKDSLRPLHGRKDFLLDGIGECVSLCVFPHFFVLYVRKVVAADLLDNLRVIVHRHFCLVKIEQVLCLEDSLGLYSSL
jgi:hypothetical protein